MGKQNSLSEVDNKIKALSNKYGEDAGVCDNLLLLCNLLGFKIFSIRFKKDNVDGFIIIDKDVFPEFNAKKVIGVNKNLDYCAQRFTIAHELAHYYLDGFENGKELPIFAYREYSSNEPTDKDKYDYFAVCLLMPESLFKKKFNSISLRNNSFVEVVEQLSVFF